MKPISSMGCFLQMLSWLHSFPWSPPPFWPGFRTDVWPSACTTIITEQFVVSASIFIIFCNLLATLPTPILAARLSYCASNVVGNCIRASLSIAKLCCGGIHLNKLYRLVRVWCLLGSDLALIMLSYCFILRKWQAWNSVSFQPLWNHVSSLFSWDFIR